MVKLQIIWMSCFQKNITIDIILEAMEIILS